MSEITNSSSAEFMNRVEGRLQSLSNSLKRLEEKSDVPFVADKNDLTDFDSNITDDLTEVKSSLQKLRGARQDIYRYSFAQNRRKDFNSLDEIKRLADVMTGLEQRIGDLFVQCEKLESVRQNFERFSAEDTLNELLRKSEENLSRLDNCDKKISDTADVVAAKFESIKSALDKRITDALNLEREFLISCRELSNTTKNLTGVVNGIDTRQSPDTALALDSFYDKISNRLQNMEDTLGKVTVAPPPEQIVSSNEKVFENLCLKIYESISNERNATVYNEIKSSKINADDASKLEAWNPAIYEKVLAYVRGINHFVKVYTDITKILKEAEQ